MDAPGVEVRPLRQLTGGASFTEVFLEDVFLTDDLRVGDAGDGWRVAVSTLTAERTSTGDRSHGMTKRAAELLRALAVRTGATDGAAAPSGAGGRPRPARGRRGATSDGCRRCRRTSCAGPERAIDKLLLADNLRRLGDAAAAILGPAVCADTGEWGTYAWGALDPRRHRLPARRRHRRDPEDDDRRAAPRTAPRNRR